MKRPKIGIKSFKKCFLIIIHKLESYLDAPGSSPRFQRQGFLHAFGEVLAEELTRCHSETSHDYNLWILEAESDEILG